MVTGMDEVHQNFEFNTTSSTEVSVLTMPLLIQGH